MVNWIEEYIKGLERTENTISSEEYINWLKNYTRTKFKISDTDYQYYSDTLDDNDREHLDLLRSLFDGIDKYAYENELYPTLCEYGLYYNVMYNDFYFKVGIITGKENYCFCEKMIFNKGISFIDFKDIMNDHKKNADRKHKVLKIYKSKK